MNDDTEQPIQYSDKLNELNTVHKSMLHNINCNKANQGKGKSDLHVIGNTMRTYGQ
jgi:hypothetical protein